MLGSKIDFRVGFDITSMQGINNLEGLHKLFDPQTQGTNMVLKHH